MQEISLYIHIPFCVSKCYYCDFSSFSNLNHKIKLYINSLIIELSLYREKIKGYKIKTIFIGGGTPSCLEPKHIYKIMKYIYDNFNIEDLIEVTIEANPGTLDKEKINIYKQSGINRVSMGAQTLDNNLLTLIGRSHKVEDFYKSFKLLRQANINNINVDLMFGLPNQKLEDVIDSLKKVLELKVEHISYYGLILEEGTYLNKLFNEKKIFLPNEEDERSMYHEVVDTLIQNGYNHYEISNFSLPNYECNHNLVYWNIKPYLGVGLSSHSNIEKTRFWNTTDINKYIEELNKIKLPVEGEEIINFDTEIDEFCILGLRKIMGIDKREFKNRFGIEIENIYKDIINKHISNGLINNTRDYIYLTKKGLDLSNLVEMDFLR